MVPLPYLIVILAWLYGWAQTSYDVIRFIKETPDKDDPGFLLREIWLPGLVAKLLITWPVLCVQMLLIALRIRREDRSS